MTPPDAVHHVYIVVFSTLVPRAKLQSGVSLAVLWKGVSELSVISDTEYCLIGTNLWLPSWDFLKEFVKGRKENTRRSSNWNWIRWEDIFVRVTIFKKWKVKHVYEEHQNTNRRHKRSVRHVRARLYRGTPAGQPSHTVQTQLQSQRSKQIRQGASLIATVVRATVATKKQTNTRLLVNSYEIKQVSSVNWYRYTEWLRCEGNSQITI